MSEFKNKHIEYKLLQNGYCIECKDKPCMPETCSRIGHLFAEQYIKERDDFIETVKKIVEKAGYYDMNPTHSRKEALEDYLNRVLKELDKLKEGGEE